MQYLGGKSRDAKRLAVEIDKVRKPGQLVWDAFCGGLSMTRALRGKGPVLSTDACVPLIALYQAVQAGWDPPSDVTPETYRAARILGDSDPMKAFCGFGMSFGGKWFGGYAKPRKGHEKGNAPHARASLLRDCPGGIFSPVDFLSVDPDPTCDAILYLDPPYRGTTGYGATGPFDHDAFESRVVEWARYVHVFVSEYDFPHGDCIAEIQTSTEKRLRQGAVERLYHLKPTGAVRPEKAVVIDMAAKKFGTGKPAPQVRNDVSPYAAQFAASDAGKSRHPQFEVGTHDCTFLGIEMPDAPPGKDPWAIAHFQLEDSTECVALNCMNSRSLKTSLERLKSLMIAVVGCPSREDYDAFDPEGVFFSAMLGYENERAADAAPYLEGTRKVRVIVTRGKDLEDGSDFFRNVSYEMHPDVAAENA